MKVIITLTCLWQKTEEILRYYFPDAEFIQIKVSEIAGNPEGRERLIHELQSADYWIYLDLVPLRGFVGFAIPPEKTICLPIVTFSAFHPDLIFVDKRGGDRLIGPAQDCQSAIALWAYLNKFSVEETVALFTPENFEMLGYLDYWNASVESMQADFASCDLDFRNYYTRVKRHGAFMHTVNHPAVIGIVELIRLIVPKLGYTGDPHTVPVERYIQDNFTSMIWPVYPGVGERLGINPLMRWRIEDEIIDLMTFIERSFAAFGDIDSASIISPRLNNPFYDTVLGGV